ncbi:MAG: hypothetical protein OHK0046_08330 [Anaerolineae bacterium]
MYPNAFDEDTQQNVTLLNERRSGRPFLGILLLLIAAGFTAATVFLLLNPDDTDPLPQADVINPTEAVSNPTQSEPTTTTDSAASATPEEAEDSAEDAPQQTVNEGVLATLDPQTANTLLSSDLQSLRLSDALRIEGSGLNPFTIIPDRPRNEIIQYTVVQGDTIQAIADRFGLQPETIAWSNPRRIIQVLRPGDVLNIPPVDGVLAQAIGSTNTIADYTRRYQIDDPYTVLDSEYNQLVGYTPETVPPTGTEIFFPGGTGEDIVWVAEIEVSEGGGGTSGNAGVATVRFQPGQPGDCGNIAIGGGSVWVNPIPSGNYTVTRGFTPVVHPGIDLAGSIGTPIHAANGGTVIFSGWNGFGYGNMVAIIHGPNMTVYGHMESVFATCGQAVNAGDQIGTMGSTGNSSGPHLHFEIRGRSGNTYIPLSPGATIGF